MTATLFTDSPLLSPAQLVTPPASGFVKPNLRSAILNLDAILAERSVHFVTLNGVNHPIAQLPVETYLRYEKLREQLQQLEAQGDSAPKNDEQTVALLNSVLALLVPTLPENVADLPIDVYMELVEFVMEHVKPPTPEGVDEDSSTDDGEALPPGE